MKKKIIIVLGMHRSGTSALTKLLNMTGVSLGNEEDLMHVDEVDDNPKGHFEHNDITHLNDQLMCANKFPWDQVRGFDINIFTPRSVDSYVKAMRPVLEKLTSEHEVVAVKDPRMCLLFPLWRKYFDYDYTVIFVSRNPVEVALSLCKRDGLLPRHSIALWRLYNAIGLQAALELPCCYINHEDVMRDPVAVVKGMVSFLKEQAFDINYPGDEAITDFIDPSLYRQAVKQYDWQSMLSGSQLDLYHQLLDKGKGAGQKQYCWWCASLLYRHLSRFVRTFRIRYARYVKPYTPLKIKDAKLKAKFDECMKLYKARESG